MADLSKQLDQVYGLPLDEFIAGRDALAADLREAGDAAAGDVKKLRRPSVAGWAVNQVVRKHRGEVQKLLELGEEMRAAQRAALSGGGADSIREVTARRRKIVDRLLDRAGDVLSEGGHATSRSTLDKVGDTLMAVTVDQDAAEAVGAGRLTRELAPPSGFEALADQISAPSKKKPSRKDTRGRDRTRRIEQQAREAADAAAEADREARRLQEQAESLRKEAERARRRADRAAERAKELRRKADERAP